MDVAESYAHRRQTLLLVAAVGFLIWQLSLIAHDGATNGAFALIGIAGCLIFLAALAAIFVWTRAVRNAGAGPALNDEMTRHNRLVALVSGFWTMLIISAALFAAAQFFPIGGSAAARLILTFGVVAPLVRFAFIERG